MCRTCCLIADVPIRSTVEERLHLSPTVGAQNSTAQPSCLSSSADDKTLQLLWQENAPCDLAVLALSSFISENSCRSNSSGSDYILNNNEDEASSSLRLVNSLQENNTNSSENTTKKNERSYNNDDSLAWMFDALTTATNERHNNGNDSHSNNTNNNTPMNNVVYPQQNYHYTIQSVSKLTDNTYPFFYPMTLSQLQQKKNAMIDTIRNNNNDSSKSSNALDLTSTSAASEEIRNALNKNDFDWTVSLEHEKDVSMTDISNRKNNSMTANSPAINLPYSPYKMISVQGNTNVNANNNPYYTDEQLYPTKQHCQQDTVITEKAIGTIKADINAIPQPTHDSYCPSSNYSSPIIVPVKKNEHDKRAILPTVTTSESTSATRQNSSNARSSILHFVVEDGMKRECDNDDDSFIKRHAPSYSRIDIEVNTNDNLDKQADHIPPYERDAICSHAITLNCKRLLGLSSRMTPASVQHYEGGDDDNIIQKDGCPKVGFLLNTANVIQAYHIPSTIVVESGSLAVKLPKELRDLMKDKIERRVNDETSSESRSRLTLNHLLKENSVYSNDSMSNHVPDCDLNPPVTSTGTSSCSYRINKRGCMAEDVTRIRGLSRRQVLQEILIRTSSSNMKELDIILSSFIASCSRSLTTTQLRQLLHVLTIVPKHRLFNWISGQAELPSKRLSPLGSFSRGHKNLSACSMLAEDSGFAVTASEWETDFVAGQMLLSYLNVNHPHVRRFECF